MIRHEQLADPLLAFVRAPIVLKGTCYGHGTIVARSVFARADRPDVQDVIAYDVRMVDGSIKRVTPDHICSPTNVASRMIRPAPLTIPAAPPLQVVS